MRFEGGDVMSVICKTLLGVGVVIAGLATSSFAQVPRFGHVFIVVEENHGYSAVIGNPDMLYFNNLANQYGRATNYYANAHPSIGNYFALTTGEVITTNDRFGGTVTDDNIVHELVSAGKTWKCYAESLPLIGYTGFDVYPYAKRHNPFAYFSEVRNDPAQSANLVPFSQFAIDLAAGSLPEYSFIVPNLQNDGHDCPTRPPICTDADKLRNLDGWLQTNIDPLVQSSLFQADGLLIIVFDEGEDADVTNGGGHIAAVVVSPKIKQLGYRGRALYQHQSVLKLMASALGLTHFPGSSAFVSDMRQFFGKATWSCPVQADNTFTVSICSPSDGTTLSSPLPVFAMSISNNPLVLVELDVDGVAVGASTASPLSTQVNLPPGAHLLTVRAIDNTGNQASSTVSVDVVPK